MQEYTQNIIILNETDSTNNYATRMVSEDKAVNGSMVLSQYQNNGRGQRGNSWQSEPGNNMLVSLIFFPRFLPPAKQFYLSKITSLALVDLLGEYIQGISIKWPNDIYVENRKIAGILIETSIMGNLFHSAVAGIGLNLNQVDFSTELPNPVSVKMLTGNDIDVMETAVAFRGIFMEWYMKLESGLFPEIDSKYHSKLFRVNEWADFRAGNNQFEARILGTGEFGQLILEERSGDQTAWMFKEIEFVI